MPSQAFTIVDDALRFSPAYGTLGGNAARIFLDLLAGLKRAFCQGRLNESAMGWIAFPRSMLSFRVNPRTWARAIAALEHAGFIEVLRSPGRPYMIAMSRKWRSYGHGTHYCTTLVRNTRVPAVPPSDSPLKSFNQDHTIRKGEVDGGHLHDAEREPEEESRPPVVNLDALCRVLGDVAGVEGRNNVRRAIAGKPRGLIVRSYKAVNASRGVRSTTALFIYRLKNGWRPPAKLARAIELRSCEEPVHIGAMAQRLALQMASATCQKSVEQHAYNTGTPRLPHRNLTGRSPGPHRQVTRTSR